MRRGMMCALSLGFSIAAGCGGSVSTAASNAPSTSEVAASVVSGAINNAAGVTLGWNLAPGQVQRSPIFDRLIDELNPIGKAYAAVWMCSGGTLSPTRFDGDGTYTFTPVSCSITWANNRTASSQWSSTFTLAYTGACDTTNAWIGNQTGACTLTRTTLPGGNTRTITGPNGNAYAITHDTNGAGTGWDGTVSPAPANGGVVVVCNAGGCPTNGGTLAISGSHVRGTVTPSGQGPTTIWDHTVTTAGAPLTFTGSATTRLFNGSVTVQHNLAKFTATSTFNDVGFGNSRCCFPTRGSVTTTFQSGQFQGDTETLTFGPICGEETLTMTNGATVPVTLQHCL